jgi:outer membrane immunogenic protein
MGQRWRIAVLSVGLMSSAALGDEYGGPYRPYPSDVPAPRVSAFSWTGLNVGGHFGFVYSDTAFDYAATPLANCVAIVGTADDCQTRGNVNSNSLAGGVQPGFNHQIGDFVWGQEGDLTWRGHDAGKATFLPAFGVVQDFFESNDWLITPRPRLGFCYYRSFIYATGVAWSSASHTISFHDPANLFTPLTMRESATRTGWALGAGLEYVLTAHQTFKGEYLFVDLGSVTVPTQSVGGWWATVTRFCEEEHILRAALDYKF